MSDEIEENLGITLPPPQALDAFATRIYLLAVRTPGLTRLQIVTAGVPTHSIDAAIDLLGAQGMIRETGVDAWEAITPEVALPMLATTYEARAAQARTTMLDLAQVYRMARTRPDDPQPGVVVLANTEELASAIQTVRGSATAQIWAAYDESPSTAHLFAADLDWHRERLITRDGAPLQRYTTFDTSAIHHPRAGDVLTARAESGEEIRFLTGLPFSAIVADDAIGVIDLTSYDSSGDGSLLVHDRRVVLALRAMCEAWWQLATPTAWASTGTLDRRSRLVLSLLAAGATDATIAARSGLSQRTVERRVRALMTHLGAVTRFQAGVQAARRGWI